MQRRRLGKVKRSKFNDIDEKIKDALIQKTAYISVSENMLDNIKEKIYNNEPCYGGLSMKKRIVAITAACVLCVTAAVTVFSAMKVEIWHSSSSAEDEITGFPTKKEIKKGAGYVPKYVENLSDKYTFMSAHFGHSVGESADGEKVAEVSEVIFYYTDQSGDFENHNKTLTVFCENMDKGNFLGEEEKEAFSYNDTDIYYYEFVSKFFPPGYEGKNIDDFLSEEEKKLNEEGNLNIAFGSSEIETMSYKTLSWYEDGIGYRMMAMECDELDKNEMLEMAKRIIDSK